MFPTFTRKYGNSPDIFQQVCMFPCGAINIPRTVHSHQHPRSTCLPFPTKSFRLRSYNFNYNAT